MWLAMPGEKTDDGKRFALLIQDENGNLYRTKVFNVTPYRIAKFISYISNTPIERVHFKEEKTVMRGTMRGMTTFSFMVMNDIPAPF
jgi:hypothetical protein